MTAVELPPVQASADASGLARLRSLMGERKVLIIWLVMSSVTAGFAEAGLLAVAAQIASGLVDNQRRIHENLGPIHLHASLVTLSLFALGFALLRLLLQIPISYCPAAITANVESRMRADGFAAFVNASWAVQSEDRSGYFQELMTNQITSAGFGVVSACSLVVASVTFVVLAVSAFALNAIAAVVIFVIAVALFFLLRPLNRSAHGAATQLSASQMDLAAMIVEVNTTAEEVRVFGTEQAERERLARLNGSVKTHLLLSQILSRAVPNIYQSVIYLLLGIGLLGLTEAHVGHFSELGAVVLLLVRAGTYGQQVQQYYINVRQAAPFAERVDRAERHYSAARDVGGNAQLGPIASLSFDKVSYAYSPTRPILRNVSFSVKAGDTIGVVGPSGAGKSTLVQILLRLRSPADGHLLVNGRDAQEYSHAEWVRRVAYVPQQPRLVHGSVSDNVRFSRAISDEAVQQACRLARIHEEVVNWPEGYQTIIGPREAAVSGGQQQRICMARALAGNPELLVLDEPTSALDPTSEALIQESLVSLQSGLTLFIVAHRMSTLSICDKVIVLLAGEVDAFDSVESLRVSNDYYRHASALASGSRSASESDSATG